jgi:hypothetical protein
MDRRSLRSLQREIKLCKLQRERVSADLSFGGRAALGAIDKCTLYIVAGTGKFKMHGYG